MAIPVTVEATEVQKIEEALHILVSAAVSPEGYARNPANSERFEILSIAQILAEDHGRTEIERRARALINQPIGEAVRRGIRTLGKRLNEIGGRELMSDVIDRVADRDPAKWGLRVDVMDKRWDGIGHWYA